MGALDGLSPPLVWKYFGEISRIPRCSKAEGKIRQYVLDVARRLGLAARSDAVGNIVVRKPASAGRERSRSICLQGHLDMVCEKNKGKTHDFSRDPIALVRRGNMLMADGTTLGADNGVAVAAHLAIMEDRTVSHGPLELLFTVDEETGLTGAAGLPSDFLESRTMLNLDSEEEGSVYVGCSGGRDTRAAWKLILDPVARGMVGARVSVTGLKGGHSGLEIDKGRGNAIKILTRALLALEPLGARLSAIQGGNKHNAIPREADAVVFVPARAWPDAERAVKEFAVLARAEVETVDPGLTLTLTRLDGKRGKVFKRAQQSRLLRAVSGLPHGVTKMSADIPGLVETSTNVAVIATERGRVRLVTSQRSSVASEIAEIVHSVRSILELAGATVEHGDGYPGWKPNLESPILKVAQRTFRELYGKDPAVKAIHAGLECGIIGERMNGMDMLSFGPTLEGVHSPDEKIHIDTVERFWNFLVAILRNAN